MVVPHAPDRRPRHDQQEDRQRQYQTPNSPWAFEALKQDGPV
jgi:hypothetical protein